MTAWGRLLLVVVVLVTATLLAVDRLSLDHRLDRFLPLPVDEQQALVVDQISAGAGGRVILAALSGVEASQLAEYSQALRQRWQAVPGVERVDNGILAFDERTLDQLMQTRFLLLPDIEQRLTETAIAAQLDERFAELALAGRQIEPLIRRDPLGLLAAWAEQLTRVSAAQRFDGVWLDQDGEQALLLVVSAWPAFAIAEQAALLAALQEHVTLLAQATDRDLSLQLAGAPVIAVDSATRSRDNAVLLSSISSGFLVLLLLWVWRSPLLVIAGALPVASGVVCGLWVSILVFDQVHGLTLAFGFTLLGVALDYPIHLFSHAAGRRFDQAMVAIRRPLVLGAVSSLIAYLSIWLSASPGLAQLGAFSAAGLAAAALTTVLLLPHLGLSVPVATLRPQQPWMPYWPWLPAASAGLAMMILLIQGDELWSADLTRLSPINPALLAADIELRQSLGAGEVRYILVITAADRETVLRATEATTHVLAQARDQGLVSAWQAVTDVLPSLSAQQQRREAWLDVEVLAELIAVADPRFQTGAFQPFLEDLAGLPHLVAITPETWQGTPLALQVETLLTATPGGWRSLILPSGLNDAEALAEWLALTQAPAHLVDLRATSEGMVNNYRREVGGSLVIALVLIGVLLLARLQRARLVGQVLLPPLAAVLCTAAIFSLLEDGLTLVHLVGLLLAGGIGLDFAIFARTVAADRQSRECTYRAINLCALSSGGVFFILGQSDIGLLNILGLTVALGILLSWWFTRLSQPPYSPPSC